MNEFIGIDLEVNTDKLSKGLKDAENSVKNTKNKIAKDKEIELAVKVAGLQQEFDKLKLWRKNAVKLGKDDIVFRIDASLEPLKNKLAQAKRELRNFQNTGDTEKSLLGNMLNSAGIP